MTARTTGSSTIADLAGVLPENFVLGVVAAFVVGGRLRKSPIAARGSQA